MNTSDNISSNRPVGEISEPQTVTTESTAPSTFSGIPGLGRIGHAPKFTEAAAESFVGSNIVNSANEPRAPVEVLDNVAAETQKDSIMMDAEPLEESAQTTINDATLQTKTETIEAPEVLSNSSLPANGQTNSEPLQSLNERTKVEGEEVKDESEPKISQLGLKQTEESMSEMATEPPELTHALEALLGLSQPTSSINDAPSVSAPVQPTEEEHPEWEIDSSPIESSSDDSSSDDSSSEDSDEDEESNSYKLLSPEEQARILMEGDGGSDDEGTAKGAKGTGGQVRTKNELPEEVIPKPDVAITPEMRIEELGNVETIVDSIVLIKAKTSGEYRVLNQESVLCLADRSVIGVVSETLGRVEQPLYCVRFTNAASITEAGLTIGTKVFYSEQHSTYVFTQALKAYKGSDASNLHDEEVGDEEMEFSDDEAEAEHKRRIKQKKLERRGGKMQQNGGSTRSGHPLQQNYTPGDNNGGLSYDESEDGPYKTLTRPVGFTGVAGGEAPQEGSHYNKPNHRGDHGGRGRGRGRGDRGRGRGGGQNDRNNGYSSHSHTNNGYTPSNPSPAGLFNPQAAPLPQGRGYLPYPPPPNNSYSNPNQHQYPAQQPQMWPGFPQGFQQAYQQPFSNPQNAWPTMPPPLPSGAFINPAFFNQPGGTNQWNQQGPQNGNERK